MAELVEAEKLHLPQALKMHSQSSREQCHLEVGDPERNVYVQVRVGDCSWNHSG